MGDPYIAVLYTDRKYNTVHRNTPHICPQLIRTGGILSTLQPVTDIQVGSRGSCLFRPTDPTNSVI